MKVVNKNDAKKRRRDESQDTIPESPKKAKVHAQRKFAQGAAFNSPSLTVIKDKVRPPSNISSPGLVLSAKRPNTEDFLTFLCFRRTSILPPKLDFFKDAFKHQPIPASTNSGHKMPNSANKSNAADTSTKHSSKKSDKNDANRKIQQTPVQALRKKYQEQRLAKQKPTNVTKLAQKVKGKNMIRTRSSTLQEEKSKADKSAPVNKEKLAPFSGLRSGLQRSPPAIASGKNVKKPEKIEEVKNLRSRIKGKVITKNWKAKSAPEKKVSKSAPKEPPLKRVEPIKNSKISEAKVKDLRVSIKKVEGLSDFSSDDNEPLLCVKKAKAIVKDKKVVNLRDSTRSNAVKTRSQLAEVSPVSSGQTRPTRKTKEAAAIYMEMITKKLVSPDKSGDDDRSSVDSFPELPNARRNEQRESEIKAKAMAMKKSNASDSKSVRSSEDGQKSRFSGSSFRRRELTRRHETKCETPKKSSKENQGRKAIDDELPKRSTREPSKRVGKVPESKKDSGRKNIREEPRKVKEELRSKSNTGVNSLTSKKGLAEDASKKPAKEDISKKSQKEEAGKKGSQEDVSKKPEQLKKSAEVVRKVTKEELPKKDNACRKPTKEELSKKPVKDDASKKILDELPKKSVKEEFIRKNLKEDDFSEAGSEDAAKEVQTKKVDLAADDAKELKKVEEVSKKCLKEDVKKSFVEDQVKKGRGDDFAPEVSVIKITVEKEAVKKVKEEPVKKAVPEDKTKVCEDHVRKPLLKENSSKKDGKLDAEDKEPRMELPRRVETVLKEVSRRKEAIEINCIVLNSDEPKKSVEYVKKNPEAPKNSIKNLTQEEMLKEEALTRKCTVEDLSPRTSFREEVAKKDAPSRTILDEFVKIVIMDEAMRKASMEGLRKNFNDSTKSEVKIEHKEVHVSIGQSDIVPVHNSMQENVDKKKTELETRKSGDVTKSRNQVDAARKVENVKVKNTEEQVVGGRLKEDVPKKNVDEAVVPDTNDVQKATDTKNQIKINKVDEDAVDGRSEEEGDGKPTTRGKKLDEPELKLKKVPERVSGAKKPSTFVKKGCASGSSVPSYSWMPPAGTKSNLVEAPTFYPTEKEFQDPLEFFERIRPAAESFGLCRIVPPSTFKPDCKVSDDMRFTAYNQYVHRMFHRWGPNIKEMMAIKKYLATQSISLKQPPWIGGIEVDLPRLYQSVQNCGGLMKVMEKKKWNQVADMMRIPKAAQDRVTKLDDIYCKYLLPYDTLSHDERQKLFDEVEKDWLKRQETTNDSSEEDSEEELYIDECEECIVKGRNMALNQFYRIARNTMSMWFKNQEPSPSEVENEFWRHVSERNNHVCVHSGSIDSSGWGYGFPVTKNNSFSRHPWNLKVLTNNSGSVLRSLGPVMGVTVPTLHVGMVFTAFCWYRDPHGLPWVEYLHTGAPKIWYGISDDNSSVFKDALTKLLPRYIKNKKIWLPSDTAMVPPALLVEQGVSLCHTIQKPGQFILVFPRAFTSSICTGYLVSESVYFAQPSWLTTAEQVFRDIQDCCEPTMFSLEKLLFSIATDSRSSVEVLKQVLPMVWHIKQNEIDGRKTLFNLGLKVSERLPIRDQGGSKKKKGRWAQDGEGDYECEVCRTNLCVSLVINSQEEGVLCLPHAIELLTQKRHHLKYCKLMYSYTQEELQELVEKLEQRIESKSQKRVQGKLSSNSK